MARPIGAIQPGSAERQNEDAFRIEGDFIAVADGATERTESGCVHGAAWLAMQLAAYAVKRRRSADLASALELSIGDVVSAHIDRCNLAHPGSPSAAVALCRRRGSDLEWLVLADVTVLIRTDDGLEIHSQDHHHVAADLRAEADHYLIGDPRKTRVLEQMKHIENAQRNQPGGFWVAGTDPRAANHALTGTVPVGFTAASYRKPHAAVRLPNSQHRRSRYIVF
jgi:hypothetical protein